MGLNTRWAYLALVLLVSGCVSTPKPVVIDTIDKSAVPKKTMLDLIENGYTSEQRNTWIEFNLIRIENDYTAYQDALKTGRKKWNIGSSTAALLFNVASSLTDSAGVKANYVAANSLAVGANQIVSREEFYNQTVSILISSMDARRAKAYEAIQIGMSRPTGEYKISRADKDLRRYRAAGSLEDGIAFGAAAVMEASDKQEAKSEKAINEAVSFTEEERQQSFCVSESLDELLPKKGEKDDPAKRAALVLVLQELNVQFDGTATIEGLVEALSLSRDTATPVYQRRVEEVMAKQKLMLSPCPRRH